MNRSHVPLTAFVDPTGKNQSEVEKLAHQILTRLLEHLSHAGERSPLPAPIEVTDIATISETPIDFSVLLEQIDRILTASMNVANPGYIGHMDSIPT